MQPPVFCGYCGGPLERSAGAPARCSRCGRVAYLDPKLAVACIACIDGRLLLVRRGIEPHVGEWSLPSGYVNRGESVELAAEREVQEETALRVKARWLVGLYSTEDDPVVLAVYDARVIGGEMAAGDECLDVGLFATDDLPQLAFEHDARILEDWRAERQRRGAS